ncbi:MAG: biotin carboxylase, partial [Planctomycetes bacterium]|nr:biotin carboxylase [Planctomycetota bacterium]
MPRLLLLVPTTTYRTEAFVEAARGLGVELVVASERPSTLEARVPDRLITLDFLHPERSTERVSEFHSRHPLDAVVPVDDLTTVAAAAISALLGLRSNPVSAARAARNKQVQREALRLAAVPVPRFRLTTLDDDPSAIALQV